MSHPPPSDCLRDLMNWLLGQPKLGSPYGGSWDIVDVVEWCGGGTTPSLRVCDYLQICILCTNLLSHARLIVLLINDVCSHTPGYRQSLTSYPPRYNNTPSYSQSSVLLLVHNGPSVWKKFSLLPTLSTLMSNLRTVLFDNYQNCANTALCSSHVHNSQTHCQYLRDGRESAGHQGIFRTVSRKY